MEDWVAKRDWETERLASGVEKGRRDGVVRTKSSPKDFGKGRSNTLRKINKPGEVA